MSKTFNIVEHVLDHADYVNDDGFDYRLPHENLQQFVISFHDLQFLGRKESSLEVLGKIADEIKANPVTWKERKKLKAGVKHYERIGRTKDCLIVVHDHLDHPHIHFVYPKLQLNKKKTKYIKRGYGLNFHQLKCHIKVICDKYDVEPNFYLTAQERQAFRNPEIDSKLKKTLSHLSWQMKQNPKVRINYSKEQIMKMLETYGKQSGDMSFVNKFISLWNEIQNDNLPPALLEHDGKLLYILEENDSEKLLSSINETNYRSIILNDLIRHLYHKATNLLHRLIDLSTLKYPKSIAKRILDIKQNTKKAILNKAQNIPIKPSIYHVFNKALSHVMKHSKSHDDIHDSLQKYFDDIGIDSQLKGFMPFLDDTGYYIPVEKTLYKKKKQLRQKLIKNTLENVTSFRPLRSIKNQIASLRKKPRNMKQTPITPNLSPPDMTM